MMKRIFILVVYVIISVYALLDIAQAIEVKRQIEYVRGSTDALDLDHKYGNATITTWNDERTVVRVVFTARAATQKIANIILSSLDVKFDYSVPLSRVTTVINHDAISSYNRGSSSTSYNIQIFISLPATARLNLACKYGNVAVGDTKRDLTAQIKYGNLICSSIAQRATITTKYGNVSVGDLGADMTADVKYGNLNAGNVTGTLNLNVKYGNVYIKSASSAVGYVGYGNLSVGRVGSLRCSAVSYGRCSIDLVQRELVIDKLSYGSLYAYLDQDVTNVDVGASCSSVVLTTSPKMRSYSYELKTSYSLVSVQMPGLSATSNDGCLTGVVGAEANGAKTKIRVINSYESITLKSK